MTLAELPSVRTMLEAHGLSADKRLGQHFLFDLNITRKIARLAHVGPGDIVIEVGPGPGGLTRALLETGAQVIAVEKDARLLPLLSTLVAVSDGALTLVPADALKVALESLIAPGSVAHIVANLPYNVGTALLLGWLTGPVQPASMTLMFQKEVAERLTAMPGSGAYGRLSVITQTLCKAEILLDLPARAFSPPPKVDSAVVRLVTKSDRPSPQFCNALERVTAAAFGQRRKMLRSSLKALGGEALCRTVGIDPNARAETVDIETFIALAAVVACP